MNDIFYFDDAVVSRTSKLYKIVLDEHEKITICVHADKVNPIAETTNLDDNLIAILLATIELVRRSRTKIDRSLPCKLDDKVVTEGLKSLLNAVPIEEVIIKFKSLKWHEIKAILSSKSPARTLEEL